MAKTHFLFARMGTGKTPTTVYSLYYTRPDTVLILCPKNAIRVWEDHIIAWFAGLDAKEGRTTPFIIRRDRMKYNNAEKRKALWREFTPGVMNIYITTNPGYLYDYDCFSRMQIVINDEAKRIMGHSTRKKPHKVFEALKPLIRKADLFWPMTGTPGFLPKHSWNLFHLADPDYFSSYWKFVNAYHYVLKNEWGGQEILTIRNKEAWYLTLKQWASVITKEMVKDQLPDSIRVPRPIEMDAVQETLYRQLSEEMVAQHGESIIITPNSLTRLLNLRQLLVCPKILDPKLPSYGAAIEDWISTVQAGEADAHSVIFTPFKSAFPYWKERLESAGINNVFTLQGGTSPDEQQDILSRYRNARGTMLCTIQYAQAFSLEPATESYFIGFEYDPDANDQAESRLVRITSDRSVPRTHYYYGHTDTYDYEHMSNITDKVRKGRVTFSPANVDLKMT